MAADDPTRKSSSVGRLDVVFTLVAALPLLDAAWMLAQRPPGPTAGAARWESGSCGLSLLLFGGLPWLIQWAVCALTFAVVVRRRTGTGWTTVLFATLLPLVAGAAWWTALAAMWWNTAPVEAALDVLAWSAERSFGVEPFGVFLLFEGLGPLVCPLRLSGPISMQGWQFLWAGLSTALIMAYWIWAVNALRADQEVAKERPRRQFLLMLLAAGVYLSPLLIRATLRVAAAAGFVDNPLS
jgi:hypothetical protein